MTSVIPMRPEERYASLSAGLNSLLKRGKVSQMDALPVNRNVGDVGRLGIPLGVTEYPLHVGRRIPRRLRLVDRILRLRGLPDIGDPIVAGVAVNVVEEFGDRLAAYQQPRQPVR